MPKVGEVVERLNYAREATIVSLGIFLVDTFARGAISDHVTDNIAKKAEEALPSALVAPRISDDIGLPSHSLDLGADISMAAGSVLIAKKTTKNPWELLGVAAGAQVASSAVDAAVAQAVKLSSVERRQEDVGASAIETALVAKFLLDKANEAGSRKARRAWRSGAALFGLAVTAGASYIDRKNGTMDFTSHSAGFGVGALASYLKNRKSNDNAAAEALVA